MNKDEGVTIDCALKKDRSGKFEILVPVEIFGDKELDISDDFQILISGLPTTLNFKVHYEVSEIQGEGKLFAFKKKMKLNKQKTFDIEEVCSIGRCLTKA